jgi:hypothetical protein
MNRLLTLLLLLLAPLAGAAPHVVLVQNSGWMEPFYADPASPFKPLVTGVVTAAAKPGDPVLLASFNQSQPGAPSPRALAQLRAGGDLRAAVAAGLSGVGVARKGSGAMADTDMGEALGAAISTALKGRDGLVWIFTNNRNSPGNDLATARRNREFYALIHQDRRIAAAVAYPLRMPVRGKAYAANGLMVYLLGVGAGGEAALRELLDSGRLSGVLTERPARLKPLDRDTVRLAPRRVDGARGVTLSTAGNALLADIEPGTRSASVQVDWLLENRVYPYVIKTARVRARSALGGRMAPIALAGADTLTVRELAPGRGQPLKAELPLPVGRMPPAWSAQALSAAGSAQVVPGELEIRLDGQVLELSPAFRARMEELFPGDPLPDVFVPPPGIEGSTAALPVEVRVHFSATPLLALIGGLLAALAAGAAVVHLAIRVREVPLTVDGERRVLHARAGTSQPVYSQSGETIAQLRTTFLGHRLDAVRAGARVTLGH